MKQKGQKLIMILDLISMLCGIGALVFLFNGGVGFENPIIWIMCLIVLSSFSSLTTQIFDKKE